MDLNDLFDLARVAKETREQMCLVRHTSKELGDYLLDQKVYDFYQSVQKAGKFDKYQYVTSFFVNKDGKTLFRGVYKNLGNEQLSSKHFQELNLEKENRDHYETLRLSGKYVFYHLEKTDLLEDFDERVVIDWGDSAISWFQLYHSDKPKLIQEIIPKGYFGGVPDFLSISLTRSELEYLFLNANANPTWKSNLSRVNGVYLILDEHDGQQYIGSAYGKEGIWGRWSTYYSDPTGENKKLKEKMITDKLAYKHFRYSILEVFPGNLLKEEIILKESLYKRKFGTRTFGLNDN